ncbi:MAG TPA: M23 family metallopeptidase [bacterium]|nr:M23 family metallopeptidase [bacterium]HPN42653.1 M23 family metallopeptidase [bacterium]
MLSKPRKHRKSLQILVIPDDKDEPKTFSIPIKRLKIFQMIGVLLILHMFLGFVAYFQYFRVYNKNRELGEVNQQLEENNKRIYELVAKFEDLESSQTKIRGALGLGSSRNSDENVNMSPPAQNDDNSEENDIEEEPTPAVYPDIAPIVNPPQTSQVNREVPMIARERFGRLIRTKTLLHENFENCIPTFLPVEGVLSNDYSNLTFEGKSNHLGIDIAGERGALVKSAADGIVVFAGWTYNLGNLVIIYHGNGYFTYYGHNQRLIVERNSLVKKGDNIALLGNSGISSGHHLHFEIWKDGVPLDPKQYLLAFANN